MCVHIILASNEIRNNKKRTHARTHTQNIRNILIYIDFVALDWL